MLQCNNYLGFSCYIAISVIAGIALVALGYMLMSDNILLQSIPLD